MSTKKTSTKKSPAKKKVTKKTSTKKRQTVKAQAAADQENARLRDERAKSPDGMTASERAMSQSAGDAKRSKKTKAPAKAKKLSLIDAAVQVLDESKVPMNCKQIVEQVTAKKLWSSSAATPWATLYSSILRELQTKGKDARFKKVDRGHFTLAKKD
jgi:hypothetical protein